VRRSSGRKGRLAAMALGAVCLLGLGCAPGGVETRPQEAVDHPPADPQRAEVLYRRGLGLQRAGRIREAIELFYQSIEADPNHAPVLNHLAWLRATNLNASLRDGAEAVRLAERACKVVVRAGADSVEAANCLDTLAAAYAEAGRFEQALATALRAAAMAQRLGRRAAARDFATRAELYREGRAYRE